MRIFERWHFGLCWNLILVTRVIISWRILGFFGNFKIIAKLLLILRVLGASFSLPWWGGWFLWLYLLLGVGGGASPSSLSSLYFSFIVRLIIVSWVPSKLSLSSFLPICHILNIIPIFDTLKKLSPSLTNCSFPTPNPKARCCCCCGAFNYFNNNGSWVLTNNQCQSLYNR